MVISGEVDQKLDPPSVSVSRRMYAKCKYRRMLSMIQKWMKFIQLKVVKEHSLLVLDRVKWKWIIPEK